MLRNELTTGIQADIPFSSYLFSLDLETIFRNIAGLMGDAFAETDCDKA